MALGLLLAGIGLDTVSGQLRMTFGSVELLRGINFLVAVIGLFGISEILLTMEERLALRGHAASISLRVVLRCGARCRAIGDAAALIGDRLLAGDHAGGAIAASFMGYNLAKRFSDDPEGLARARSKACSRRRRPRMLGHRGAAARCSHSEFRDRARRRSCSAASGGRQFVGGFGVGSQSGPALVRRAQGFRLGADRLDVSRQRGRAGDGAHHRADFRCHPARAVLRHRADDRRVLRDRRLRHPECHVRRLAECSGSASSAMVFKKLNIRWRRSRSLWCSATAPRHHSVSP